MTIPNGTPCGRPGCAGQILDGYCDTCGMAPSKSAARAAARRRAETVAPPWPRARRAR